MSNVSPQLPPFTRRRLRDLADCPRRYWLRNIVQLPWPADPLPPRAEKSALLGQRFHRLMQRHFLDLEPAAIPPDLQAWWGAWLDHPIPLPPGRRLPEITLSVPLGGERLLARFDLLLLSPDGSALILDWKTARRPPDRAALAADLQTRLYPFVLAQGDHALLPANSPPIRPDQIEMLYWLAQAPAEPIRFSYSADQQEADQTAFRELVALARSMSPADEPPLAEDPGLCAPCAFRSYCRPSVPPSFDPDWHQDQPDQPDLEPQR